MAEIATVLAPEIFTGDHWEQVGKDLLKLLDKAASEFARTNLPHALTLGEEELQGLLFNAVMDIPRVIVLPTKSDPETGKQVVDATDEEVLIVSRINKARASAYALAMNAQAQRNEELKAMESNARAFAVDVGKSLISVVVSGIASSSISAGIGALVK